jgi:anti-sigma-K factor RskA
MNWYRHPDTVDRLAAEYVMGSMTPAVKRRFESVMHQQTDVAMAVQSWADATLPLLMTLPEQTPSPALWAHIEQRTQVMGVMGPKDQALPWWQRWLAPIPAGAMAFGVMLGLTLPLAVNVSRTPPMQPPTPPTTVASDLQLPASYVGVLATASGKPGLIVSSLRRGTKVDIKILSPVEVPAGSELFLWRIDKAGVMTPLGSVPAAKDKFAHLTLKEPAEAAFFPAVELAVSVETKGVTPVAPAGAFVYRGLCGKLWK